MNNFIKKIFHPKQKLLLTPSVIIDGRISKILKILSIEVEIIYLKYWREKFKKWANSSGHMKREGKRALLIIDELSKNSNIKIKEVNKIKKFADLLKVQHKDKLTYIISDDNEVEHLALLYGFQMISLNTLASIFRKKYWVGKLIDIQVFCKKDEDMSRGMLSDGTMFNILNSEVKSGIKNTYRIISIVDTEKGVTLYLRRDKETKKRQLWDLVQ